MYVADSKRLTHAGARKIAATAIGKAEQAGIAISVAIADSGGHLIVLERMDGGRFHSLHSATTKAVCSASNKRPTSSHGAQGQALDVAHALGLALAAGVPTPLAIVLSLVAAFGVGMVNGLLIAKMKMNPFIITLGMMITIRGLLLVIAGGRAVLNLPPSFTIIGQGRLVGIQYPIIVVVALTVIGDLLLRNTRFFRQNYYVGGKEQAARLSGIKVDFIKIFNYCLIAVISGIAGLMITARFGSASVTVGTGIELRVITAAIIGGASLNGGEGSVLGALLGAFFMGMLANALNLLGVDVYWQNLVTGVMLILAVVFDMINESRKEHRT
jgi:ribose transport system permease protein